jgi:hypothetical protein
MQPNKPDRPNKKSRLAIFSILLEGVPHDALIQMIIKMDGT